MATTEQASSAAEVARGYFGALERADRNAQREWYAPDMGGQIYGVIGQINTDVAVDAHVPVGGHFVRGRVIARVIGIDVGVADMDLDVEIGRAHV